MMTRTGVGIGINMFASRALSLALKSTFVEWIYGKAPRDQYVTDKHGQQDRELLSGEIFPGRAYGGDQTNYVTLGSNIAFVDNVAWAASCFVEWDIIAQNDGIFGNAAAADNWTRLQKLSAGTGYIFANDANDMVTWTFSIPTIRHHVLVQCDGSDADNLELFIDGVSQGTKTMADTAMTIASIMTISTGTYALDGSIDDFRVYGRLLDSAEIVALQTKDALGDETLWYPCEDVDNLTAFDASGNENHGTKVSWDASNHVEGNWQNLMNKYGYNQNVTYGEVPPDMSSGIIPSLDCLGNDLVYAGQAQYHGISVDAACFQGDGVAYFTVTGLLTTDTIEVETGSDTPTCTSDNRLDIADGDAVYGVTIKRGGVVWAIFPFCEGFGITAYDVSGNGKHATGTSVDETNWGTQDDFHYIRDHGVSLISVEKLLSWDFINWTNYKSTDTSNTVTITEISGGIYKNLFTVGKTYRLHITGTRSNSGTFYISNGFSPRVDLYASGSPGIIDETIDFTAQYIELYIRISTGQIGDNFTISSMSIKEIEVVIPALADKSAAADGGTIEYPQNGPNAIPGTYFHLPENIAELITADLEDRYMDIMDEGKGTFDSGTESWIAFGTNTIENDNGALKITYEDHASGAYTDFRSTFDLDTDLTVGKKYTLYLHAKALGGTQYFYINGPNIQSSEIQQDYSWISIEFIATSVTDDRLRCISMGSGNIIWIDEWFLMEQQTSTGNNYITDGEGEKWKDDNSDGVGNGWVHSSGTGTPAIVTGNGFVGNAQKIDHVTATQTDFNYTPGGNTVNGQTYQLSIKYRSDVSVQIYLRTGSDAFTADLATNTGDATTWSAIVDATAAAAIILNFRMLSGTASGYIEIDEVELRPVINSFFYEPAVLGGDPVIINTSDLPASRYLVQYYNETNRKDLLLLEAGHSLGPDDHKKLLKFTKNN